MSDYNPDANSKLGSEMEVDAGLMPAESWWSARRTLITHASHKSKAADKLSWL